ncbi:MAG: type 4a pilus biogenesis protein PilO [Actinomycetota bacterium]
MTGRNQIIVTGAGVALVLLLFFFFIIKPRAGELGDVQAQTQAEKDRTQQLQVDLDRLEALQANAPEFQATLDRFRELVPADNDVANFIFQVQTAANQAGVGFVQITPDLPEQPPEGAPLAEVRATIGAKGGYFAVQDFVRRLYDLDRALRIDVLTMTGVEDNQEAAENGRIDVQIAARVFFELPEGAADAATAPTTTTTPAPTTP